MPRFSRTALTALVTLVTAGAALADNVGLVVGNSDYEVLGDIERADLTPSRAAKEVAEALNIPRKRAYARARERSGG